MFFSIPLITSTVTLWLCSSRDHSKIKWSTINQPVTQPIVIVYTYSFRMTDLHPFDWQCRNDSYRARYQREREEGKRKEMKWKHSIFFLFYLNAFIYVINSCACIYFCILFLFTMQKCTTVLNQTEKNVFNFWTSELTTFGVIWFDSLWTGTDLSHLTCLEPIWLPLVKSEGTKWIDLAWKMNISKRHIIKGI